MNFSFPKKFIIGLVLIIIIYSLFEAWNLFRTKPISQSPTKTIIPKEETWLQQHRASELKATILGTGFESEETSTGEHYWYTFEQLLQRDFNITLKSTQTAMNLQNYEDMINTLQTPKNVQLLGSSDLLFVHYSPVNLFSNYDTQPLDAQAKEQMKINLAEQFSMLIQIISSQNPETLVIFSTLYSTEADTYGDEISIWNDVIHEMSATTTNVIALDVTPISGVFPLSKEEHQLLGNELYYRISIQKENLP
ncbi:MAG: hypothetical protein ACRCWQ_13655 [Bacilli bacterium]